VRDPVRDARAPGVVADGAAPRGATRRAWEDVRRTDVPVQQRVPLRGEVRVETRQAVRLGNTTVGAERAERQGARPVPHDSAKDVVRVARATPDRCARRGSHDVGRGESAVRGRVPLGCDFGEHGREAVGDRHATVGAEGATSARRAVVRLRPPRVIWSAAARPPDAQRGAGGDFAREEHAVAAVIPLGGELGEAIDPMLRAGRRRAFGCHAAAQSNQRAVRESPARTWTRASRGRRSRRRAE
jgi:hypothetical protein